MASLTVRQLDDELKKRLRLRAARNGRSMEDEVRDHPARRPRNETGTRADDVEPPSAAGAAEGASGRRDGNRVLLIIGGGIAAYKSLDLIRRLRERGAGALHPDRRRAASSSRRLPAGALAGERVFTDLFDRARASSTSATSGSRATPT